MNRQKVTEQILGVMTTAESAISLRHETYLTKNHDLVRDNLNRLGAAFCGSWLGYHSNVYYKDFAVPDAGARFSVEWGLMDNFASGTRGKWVEVTRGHVHSEVMKGVDSDYESKLTVATETWESALKRAHNSLESLLAVLIESGSTPMLEELKARLSSVKGRTRASDIVTFMKPKGAIPSRDSTAVSQGLGVPPHVALEAWHLSVYSAVLGLSKLVDIARTLLEYMDMHDLIEHKANVDGSRIFIGHGGSAIWRELKDFLQDRLSLDWEEFNRESQAGIATTESIQSMLDQSCFAFLLMTGEDQHIDQSVHARENVIHEVGLFQGRLGPRRAVILLEEGCSEFSNIVGLTQIRFPKGKVGACFEDVRRVLEREGILPG